MRMRIPKITSGGTYKVLYRTLQMRVQMRVFGFLYSPLMICSQFDLGFKFTVFRWFHFRTKVIYYGHHMFLFMFLI